MKKTILLFSAVISSLTVSAQEEPKSKLTFSGYMDSYFFANTNKPLSQSNLGASGTARAFDQKAGQFGFGLVQTKASYTAANGKTEAVIDLAFGPNADLGNYGNVFGPISETTSTSLAIKQAYFNWKASDKLTLTAGQFGTHIGYEVIDAPINVNYSLSNLFNNGPFYHVGVKAAYAVSSKFSLMGGVVNGIDNLIDGNRGKALIAQVYLNPAKNWNLYINGVTDGLKTNEDNADDASKSILDIVTTYQATSKLGLGLNYANGILKIGDNDAKWSGLAAYANYAVSDKFNLAGRFETFDNSEAATGLVNSDSGKGVKMNSFTLTGTVTCAGGSLLLKPEVRIDSADDNNFFENDKGAFTKGGQTTFGVAMIYKF
jgi:hypothetical protein